jgi:hypothetical protein
MSLFTSCANRLEEKLAAVSTRCHHVYVISVGLVVIFIVVAALLVLEQPICDPERGQKPAIVCAISHVNQFLCFAARLFLKICSDT